MKKLVDYTEIWETENSGGIKICKKLLCVLANGYPIYLSENYMCEIKKKTKEEVGQLKNNFSKCKIKL